MHTPSGTRAARVCGLAVLILVAASSGRAEDAPGGGPARRITEIAASPTPGVLSVSSPPARIDGVVYFSGTSFAGSGLYASDSTTDRARLLRQLDAGTPVELYGRAFFLGARGGTSNLWTTDGTPAGTVEVAPLGDYAGGLTAVGGLLYFLGPQSAVWRSDGTALGTWPLPVLGTTGISGVEFVELGGRVYFFGRENDEDEIGLWQATRSATVRRVAGFGEHLPADGSQRFAYGLARVGNRLVFFTFEGGTYRMWSSDGTEGGTTALRDFSPDFSFVCPGACFPIGPSAPVSRGESGLFFANDGEHGRELWRTNATASGTQMVRDIQPGPVGSNWPGSFGEPGAISGAGASFQLFAADDGVHGTEVWKTDGTEAGTTLVADLSPGLEGSNPYVFVAAGGAVFFYANGLLWRSDGTASGTQHFAGLAGYPSRLSEGVALVTTSGLFVSDGTNLTRVDDLARPRGLEPSQLTAGESRVFFTDLERRALWTSDGSAPGTRELRSFDSVGDFWPADGRLYFAPEERSTGSEPWVSDGSDAGTHLLADITAFGGSDAAGFTAAVGLVFFGAHDSEHGWELWSTDDTQSGTRLAADLVPGPVGSFPAAFQLFRGVVYFQTWVPDPGGLWRSDGTEAGTVEIARLPVEYLTAGPDSLFFVSWDEANGRELWRSDGTPAGTRRVSDIVSGPEGVDLGMLTPSGTQLYFLVRRYPSSELWFSDGTEAGTRRVREFFEIEWMAPFEGGILLSASDVERGRELWRSDGTSEGTVLVRDILPGPAGSEPGPPANVSGVALFAAQDSNHGRELWRTDGSDEGTFLLQDVAPGPASSTPERLTLAGRLVYFRATDEEAGAQLWALPASALTPRPADTPRLPQSLPARD